MQSCVCGSSVVQLGRPNGLRQLAWGPNSSHQLLSLGSLLALWGSCTSLPGSPSQRSVGESTRFCCFLFPTLHLGTYPLHFSGFLGVKSISAWSRHLHLVARARLLTGTQYPGSVGQVPDDPPPSGGPLVHCFMLDKEEKSLAWSERIPGWLQSSHVHAQNKWSIGASGSLMSTMMPTTPGSKVNKTWGFWRDRLI